MSEKLELTHRLRVHAEGLDNDQLEEMAEDALEALEAHAYGCALGAVASIDSDRGLIELVFQTLAPSPSARATKMSTIYAALEGHAGITIVETKDEQVRDIVAA